MHIIKVSAWNSTVNGMAANIRHDAQEWFDGWINLAVNDKRSYVDGVSAYRYLHCPVLGPKADRRYYRVRCRFFPEGKYKGKVVRLVGLRLIKGHWHWVIEATKASRGGRASR